LKGKSLIGLALNSQNDAHMLEAKRCLTRALQIDPNNEQARKILAAMPKLLEAMRGSMSEDWYNKGNSFFRSGRLEDASRCYDEALKLNPLCVEAWTNKGSCLTDSGKFEDALQCFNKALQINPQYALTWFNKGVAEDRLDLRRDATISYRRFIEQASAKHEKYVEFARRLLGEREGR